MSLPPPDLESGPNESFEMATPTALVQFQPFPTPTNRYLRDPLTKRCSASTYSSSSLPTASVRECRESGLYLHPATTYSNIRIPGPSSGSWGGQDATVRALPGLGQQPEDSQPEPASNSGDRLLTKELPEDDSNIRTLPGNLNHGANFLSAATRAHIIFSVISLWLSFGLSCIYRTRVDRLFLEADLSLGDIKEMVCHTAGDPAQRETFYHLHDISDHPKLPRFQKLLQSWDSFVETTVHEWKALNVLSALLLTAILTVLQIPGVGDYRPLRYTALVALQCALMSTIFGVAFGIQFSSMRRKYIAAEWALEAQKLRCPFFDVRHLLALPAVWLTWSTVIFLVVILMFAWRENMGDDHGPWLRHLILLNKIITSLLLVVGLVYFIKVIRCFMKWGQTVEENWKVLIDQYYRDSEVQLKQASSLPNCRNTAPQTRGVPQRGSLQLLTPPHSGATTPQVTLEPATPGFGSLRCPPSALVGTQVLDHISTSPSFRRLGSPNTLGMFSSPEQKASSEDEQDSALDTTAPLSPLMLAGGLLPESGNAHVNMGTKAASVKKRQFINPPSRSSSVDTHSFSFAHQDPGLSSGDGPRLQPIMRRTHANRLAALPNNAIGAPLTPTRTY